MHKKFLIIGAGPTGLGAAYRLIDLGETDFLILEGLDYPGGLATSFLDDKGFTWDIGGHVQFSHYKYFDDVMDEALGADGWLYHERESWVWIYNRFVPYPFQNNIRYLDKDPLWACLKGIIEANSAADTTPANFEEWILKIFGRGIADTFMLPYNYKVWAYQPKDMAFQWIGERVSVVNLMRVAENITLDKDDLSWGPNNKFRFPKHGGTGAIWRSVAKRVGANFIRFNSLVQSISANARSVTLGDGTKITYDHLISTIPLDLLAEKVVELPQALKLRAKGLKHSASNIVGIGLKGQPKPELAPKCWMYFPESDCPFYRVTLFSKYSPYNVPDARQYFSLMTETSESSDKPVNQETLIDETIQGLRNTKLISDKDQVVTRWSHRASYGYPTPSIERDAILNDVQPALEKLNIFSRGRFGAWRYEVSNQDHSFMQGVEWVDRLVSGTPEKTVHNSC